jgi:hypothetical protein
MSSQAALILLCAGGLLSGPLFPMANGAGDKGAEALIILDGAGKEIPVKNWKFTAGTRPLAWLADAKSKEPVAQALEFRENKSTTFANGILTLVPLSSVKKIDYDHDKKDVRATVLIAGGKEEVLAGTTRFVNINKFHFDGEVPSGVSIQGPLSFQDGFLKVGGVRFPAPKANNEPSGRPATLIAQDKEKTAHKIHDLAVLYKTVKGYQNMPFLLFQKTVKIDTAQIVKMRNLPAKERKGVTNDFEVSMRDGSTQGLTLLEKTTLDEEPATLVGLIGKVPVGYKLFPAHTIAELRFEPAKEKEP